MLRRAALAVVSTALVAAGLLGGAVPANAAAITIDCENDSQSTSVGLSETLTITAAHCTIQSVSGVGTFSPSSGYIPSSVSFVSSVAGTAVLTVYGAGVSPTVLTINVGSTGAMDPALVYPTVTFDPQGGTCTTPLTITNNSGSNPTYTMPTAEECSRAGYRLFGWSPAALNADGFRPMGSRVYPAGFTANLTESVTLYAVWVPTGVEVTYDANVGSGVECLTGGASTSARTSTGVVDAGSATASTAPCSPPNVVFAGWALTGDGEVAVQPGGAIPSQWVAGSSHRLYAKWQVNYGVSVSQLSQDVAPGGTPSVTLTATTNGLPARGATISYQWTGEDEFGTFALESQTVTLNDLGAATVSMGAPVGKEGFATITAAYGDKAASATFTVVQPVTKAITITGERATVGGKPGIRVEGTATGFTPGERVIPYLRFPGQTSYSEMVARPEVDGIGSFSWERKTGKKVYVYFTNADGSVQSNRVIIQAQ